MKVAVLLLAPVIIVISTSLAIARPLEATSTSEPNRSAVDYLSFDRPRALYLLLSSNERFDLLRPGSYFSNFLIVSPIVASASPWLIPVQAHQWQRKRSASELITSATPAIVASGKKVATPAVSVGDTWMMLGVGIGLVASQLRRRQKSLHQPLPI
jgi:hypothetical protein